ncbi:DUF305 domain-containing protein [Gracilimonas tropica]|uniref:DUF305 domain-containing protein n=1 Tax=Gracilimonas tropica TaxID=454600 RepID=UPI001FE1FD81|nr:DUF305 domain-containing protein [Gracilimonas tropica]
MNFSGILRIVAILLVTGTLSACKSSEMTSGSSSEPSANNVTEPSENASTEELEELYWQRKQEALMNFSEDDVKFMTGMIAHHAQALIMSDLAPENNASPAVQRLASRIINAQKDEIKSMQRWLEDRGQPVPEVHIEGLNLMIHGLGEDHMKMDHTNMAGMLSPAQLKELSEAKGEEFDRLFLKYMIGHHQGAVTMVDKLFNSDGAVQDEAAFKLASDIQVDQRTEIDRMQLMLDEITGSVN